MAADPVDGDPEPFFRDPVVPESRADLVVAEQVAQYVGRDAFVGVPLGVAVPVGVGNHSEPVEDLARRGLPSAPVTVVTSR